MGQAGAPRRRSSTSLVASGVQCGYSGRVSTRTIGFAVAEEDEARLERLTQRFGHGNRSAFLREAMHQMEVVERAGRLAELQAYGVERSAVAGLSHEDAVQVVRRALRRR